MGRKTAVFIAIAWVGSASGLQARDRNADDDSFPDYNKIEYARPLPPVEQQQQQAKPGSIQLSVDMSHPAAADTDAVAPAPARTPPRKADDSEPPLDFMVDNSSGVQASTAPLTAAPPRSTLLK
ncbi:MAG TPA: hypothetical protein VMU17_01910 [Elusimicrobiota bacterium]|nr:hypothetical protein [Elusimicrobiota bacterium]